MVLASIRYVLLRLASAAGLGLAVLAVAAPALAQAEYNAPIYDARASQVTVHVGQSVLLRLAGKVSRIAIANQNVVDYRQTGSNELYLLGRQVGKTDLTVWYASGFVQKFHIEGSLDPIPLRQLIDAAVNHNSDIQILVSGSSFVLQGQAADMPTVDTVLRVSEAYAANLSRQLNKLESDGAETNSSGGSGSSAAPASTTQGNAPASLVSVVNQTAAPGTNRNLGSSGVVGVINSLSVRDGQQVMLEVRIAEVARSLAERMGVSLTATNTSSTNSWRVGSAFLGNGGGNASFTFFGNGPSVNIDLDAERRAGRVKILAEPTIAAMSGTEGSFLVGGSVFIPMPTASAGNNSGSNVTLEERDFGVSLKFRPTVLADRNINLDISSEVSELSREGVSYQSGQSLAILPTLTKSKVSTTVQLREGQSLIIGGLLKNNLTETKKSIPLLGDIPVLGALFRSKEFASNQTELIVVVRPFFATATDVAPTLPTNVTPASTDQKVSPPAAQANSDAASAQTP